MGKDNTIAFKCVTITLEDCFCSLASIACQSVNVIKLLAGESQKHIIISQHIQKCLIAVGMFCEGCTTCLICRKKFTELLAAKRPGCNLYHLIQTGHDQSVNYKKMLDSCRDFKLRNQEQKSLICREKNHRTACGQRPSCR